MFSKKKKVYFKNFIWRWGSFFSNNNDLESMDIHDPINENQNPNQKTTNSNILSRLIESNFSEDIDLDYSRLVLSFIL